MVNIATYEELDLSCKLLISRVSSVSIQSSLWQFLYNTGCRVHEGIQLKRIKIYSDSFIVDTEKNSLNREFDISLLPVGYLPFLPYVPSSFTSSNFGSYTTSVRLYNLLLDKRYFNLKNSVPTNIFRYRYVLGLQQQGLSVQQIALALGHLSLQSTLSYLSPLYWRS